MYSKLSSSFSLLALGGLVAGAALPSPPKVPALVNIQSSHAPKIPPLSHFDDGSMTKRDPKSDFALRDAESFYYGTDATNPIANVTGVFDGKHEHVVSMDRFVGMVSKVDCKNPDLMLDFKTAEGFQYAKDSWKWVKEDKKNKFLMVANYPGCGAENERQPYQITDIEYDEKKYKVFLKGEQQSWDQTFGKFKVHADTKGLMHKTKKTQRSEIDRRLTEDFTPSVATDFSRNILSTSYSGIDLSLDCQPCGTGGELDIEVKASMGWTGLDEASVRITPSSVSAFLTLALHASGTLAEGYETNIPVFSAALPGGIDVPFVKIGPNMNVDVGASMSDWEGEATAQYGASLNIPDDSEMFVDFLNPDSSSFSGWAPSFEPNGPSVDASITASAEIYAGASIDLSATIFSKGFEAGLILKAPDLTADFSAEASTEGGLCDNDSHAAIDVNVHLGVDLACTAGFAGSDPFFSKDIYSTGVDLFSTCIGFGGSDPTDTPSPTPSTNGTGPGTTPPPNATLAEVRRRQADRYFNAKRFY
jgi:hypothetical protein